MEEKEIELIDYLRVLKKRRWLIMIITVVFFLGSLGYSVYQAKKQKPLYKSQAIIKIGRAAGSYLDADINVVAQINSPAFLEEATGRLDWQRPPGDPHALASAFSAAAYDPRQSEEKTLAAQLAAARPDTHLIRISAAWTNPQDAQAILETAGQKLILEHQAKFNMILANYRNYLSELKKHLAVIEQEISLMKKNQRQLENDAGLKAPEVILLQANLEEREQSYLERQKEIRNQEVILSEFNSENTDFLSPPSEAVRVSRNSGSKTVPLATVAGLLLAVLLAFFLEYLEANRERLK